MSLTMIFIVHTIRNLKDSAYSRTVGIYVRKFFLYKHRLYLNTHVMMKNLHNTSRVLYFQLNPLGQVASALRAISKTKIKKTAQLHMKLHLDV